MSGALAFDLVLCALLLAVALGAVLVRDLFAGVMAFVVLGLFVAVAWARLGAVDVALAEAALGAGLTGVLLVRAAARLRADGQATPPQPAPGLRIVAGVLCLLLFAALASAVLWQPRAAGLAPAVQEHLGATGVGNPVTAVLLNFRGWDTLLETVVLLAALQAVWSLSEDHAWGGVPGLPEHARRDGVLASFARVLPPVGLLVGLHLFWAGAEAPGGAFQAATVLAAVGLLAVMAGVVRPAATTRRGLRLLVLAGPALFLLVAAAALPFGGLLLYPPSWAKAMVLLVEAGMTVSLALTLALIVAGPPAPPVPAR